MTNVISRNTSPSSRSALVRGLSVAALAAVAWALSAMGSQAHARDVYFSVGVDAPGISVGVSNARRPAVVYERPIVYERPVYYDQPEVVYERPQVIYQRPTVVYQRPQVVYERPRVVYERPVVVYRPAYGYRGYDRYDDRRDHRHHGHRRHHDRYGYGY